MSHYNSNLMDSATLRTLGLKRQNLPPNTYLRIISGDKLPIKAKLDMPLKYKGKFNNVTFSCVIYLSTYLTLRRPGLTLNWMERLIAKKRRILTNKTTPIQLVQ